MTLITICQKALNEIGDIEVPSSLFGNTNQTAKQSLALINRALKEAARETSWPPLKRSATVSLVGGTSEYDLPSDYQSFIRETIWNTSQRRMVFITDAQEWTQLQAQNIGGTTTLFFRIFRDPSGNGQKIQFYPEPGNSETVTYEYISNALTQSSGGTLQGNEFLADTDTALLDEDLITLGFKWRFLKSKGLPYSEEFTDYQLAASDRATANGAKVADFGRDSRDVISVLYIPETGFGA